MKRVKYGGYLFQDERGAIKVSYDREGDILMGEVKPDGIIDHAEHTGQFIAHFSPDGELLLLEILNASEFLAAAADATDLIKTTQTPPSPMLLWRRGAGG